MNATLFLHEIILNIAIYCHSQTILAFSRSCRSIASKRVIDSDGDEIYKNELWKCARETQYPNSRDLSFYGDAENFFIAKAANKFIIPFNVDLQMYGDIYEYNYTLKSALQFINKSYRDNMRYHLIEFNIEERYGLFISLGFVTKLYGQYANKYDGEHEIREHKTYKDTNMVVISRTKANNAVIVDFKYVPIHFLLHGDPKLISNDLFKRSIWVV